MTDPQDFNQPLSGMVTPRFAGLATFMRLPHVPLEAADGVEIGMVGVPWDGGTTNRAGPRHGPRQIRDMSAMIRQYHHALGIEPFRMANCADIGDCSVNPADLMDTLDRVTRHFLEIVGKGIVPLTAGGDHLSSLPILRAVGAARPVGMVHFDAHTDTWDSYFNGAKYTHGTPFRRAIEEGVLDPKRTVQIGIRGSLYGRQDKDWGLAQGIRVMEIEECMDLEPDKVMAIAREVAGEGPTYVSFDIDCLDPAYAPGTGTPEAGGFTTYQAQVMLRGLRGLDIVGADVVEVSPPFDASGYTALAGATMMFELVCVMAEAAARRRG
jgi:guanidinopropionase